MIDSPRNRPIRVLVVDDSVVARKVISEILDAEDDIQVVGAAANGRIALAKIPRLKPDLVTLDIDMPEMDGLETLSQIRANFSQVRVIMLSNLTRQGAAATVESLFRGASDYVTKASKMESAAAAHGYLREQLLPKIRALFGRHKTIRRKPATVPAGAGATASGRIEIVAIGVSTGGPNALKEVLSAIPAKFEVPIVIVQHMPPDFTRSLASRLNTLCPIDVFEGSDGAAVVPGGAWLAPGDLHMEVQREERKTTLLTHGGPPENSCRPAVDVLFRSVAAHFGGASLGVILTGMGQDGLRGSEDIFHGGGLILAQDQASSVVWGMPGQVVAAGLASSVLPVSEMGAEIVRVVKASRS